MRAPAGTTACTSVSDVTVNDEAGSVWNLTDDVPEKSLPVSGWLMVGAEAWIPLLAALQGKSPQGTWTLEVADKERVDTGKLRSFTLELGL